MKKLIAVVLALVLALTCAAALAEDTVVQMGANYDITIDVPAGYTMTKLPYGDMIMAKFMPDAPAAAAFTLVIVYSEEFGDYTLNDLNDEEFAEMQAMLTGDYADAVITFPETAVGTKLIQLDEQGSESEYGAVLTIYHGYFVQISLEKPDDAELTEADFQMAIDLMSSLELVQL